VLLAPDLADPDAVALVRVTLGWAANLATVHADAQSGSWLR
jgi:hypothetical protein